jgi:hypothetical protein
VGKPSLILLLVCITQAQRHSAAYKRLVPQVAVSVLCNAGLVLCVRFVRDMWQNTANVLLLDGKTDRHSRAGLKYSTSRSHNPAHNLRTLMQQVWL